MPKRAFKPGPWAGGNFPGKQYCPIRVSAIVCNTASITTLVWRRELASAWRWAADSAVQWRCQREPEGRAVGQRGQGAIEGAGSFHPQQLNTGIGNIGEVV